MEMEKETMMSDKDLSWFLGVEDETENESTSQEVTAVPEREKPNTRQFLSKMLVVQAKPSGSVKASQTTPNLIKRNFISRATRPELPVPKKYTRSDCSII